jgi:hypothetical protein
LPQRGATRDELIAWLQGSKLNPASAVGQLEGLSSPGVVVITDATAKTLSTTASASASAAETVTALTAGGAVDLTKKTTRLNAASGAFALTLGNGLYDGQEVAVIFSDPAGTGSWTASGLTNLYGFTGFVLSASAPSVRLKWDATGGRWQYMGGNVVLTP